MINLLNQVKHWLDPLVIIHTLGLIGVWAIVFAESGLLVGFFFPGDSLLFTAGFLASQGYLSIWWLALGAVIAACGGDTVGYWFGARVGPKIFTREDSFFFHKKHLLRAQAFYQRYGKETIILARFIPIVRTFAPIVAGVGQMPYRTFLAYNLIGGTVWAGGMTLFGFFLGRVVPSADKYLWPIIAAIIILSFLPPLFEWWRHRAHSN